MNAAAASPDLRHNHSDWRERLPAVALALTGCAIATYLGLYQLQVIGHVWEPFFGDGSRWILKESPVSHLLPIPDAILGAVTYLIEAVAECVGGRQRWRTWPAAVFATGAVAAGLGVTAVALVACQIYWFHNYCTLCLASAACSLAIVTLVAPEVWAAWKHYREESGHGPSTRGESGAQAARNERKGLT